jgi:hypothetical protein
MFWNSPAVTKENAPKRNKMFATAREIPSEEEVPTCFDE